MSHGAFVGVVLFTCSGCSIAVNVDTTENPPVIDADSKLVSRVTVTLCGDGTCPDNVVSGERSVCDQDCTCSAYEDETGKIGCVGVTCAPQVVDDSETCMWAISRLSQGAVETGPQPGLTLPIVYGEARPPDPIGDNGQAALEIARPLVTGHYVVAIHGRGVGATTFDVP